MRLVGRAEKVNVPVFWVWKERLSQLPVRREKRTENSGLYSNSSKDSWARIPAAALLAQTMTPATSAISIPCGASSQNPRQPSEIGTSSRADIHNHLLLEQAVTQSPKIRYQDCLRTH
ncbi:MAG: hypothetical protein WC346_10520 [Methanogenium sp.]